MDWFYQLEVYWQAGIFGLFTYSITALSAALIFFFKKIRQGFLDMMMSLAAGVMVAAAFWSLLTPAIELADELFSVAWPSTSFGFLFGGLFIVFSDILISKIIGSPLQNKNGISPSQEGKKRSILLAVAVTLHNIPEGLAIGVAFGSAALGISGATVGAAIMLAIGIGIQNFPEGICVAMPLRRDGASRLKSFMIGQASGAVEPVAAVVGAIGAICAMNALPFALSFSAGAMIAVVCSELIPEAFKNSKILASLGVLLGFTVMMILDIAFA